MTLNYSIFRYVQHIFSILAPVVSFCELEPREVPNAYASTLPSYDCGFSAETQPLLAFPPQRRQLPRRLWAPLQQETHELTTGLNYSVAFSPRGTFVSVWLVWIFLSVTLSFEFHIIAKPELLTYGAWHFVLKVLNVSLWVHLNMGGPGF